MLVPRVCAPRVTRCSLGKYWSRDLICAVSMQHPIGCQGDGRQRNLMMHAQCPLPVFCSKDIGVVIRQPGLPVLRSKVARHYFISTLQCHPSYPRGPARRRQGNQQTSAPYACLLRLSCRPRYTRISIPVYRQNT